MVAEVAAAVALMLPGVTTTCAPAAEIRDVMGYTAAGYSEPWNDRIVVDKRVCRRPLKPDSLYVIGHELGHVALYRSGGPWWDESAATCWALGETRRLARLLGASPSRASTLMRWVWGNNAAWPASWDRRCPDPRFVPARKGSRGR